MILFNEIPDKDTTNAFRHYTQRHESHTPLYPNQSFAHQENWFYRDLVDRVGTPPIFENVNIPIGLEVFTQMFSPKFKKLDQ